MSASEVSALSLGRITVQSALGEPLKAEIEVPSISAEEAASLKANVAAPAAFVAAGLEYNPAMAGLQATLGRRSDGSAVLRLSSDRAINEPFVDMILEASWASGRIVRDYTMLFDPPSLKQAAPAPTLAQVTAPAASQTATPKPAASASTEAAAPSKPSASNSNRPSVPSEAKAAPKSDSANAQQVVVQSGDSASKIAKRSKAADVSLDQMLVAMLRANPDAFFKGNLNRLRSGAVLSMPTAEQAKSISTDEAAQTVIAQSKDFNEFRRQLAGSAPQTAVDAPDRKASGSVNAKVEDKKAAAAPVDKLTLSKGALQAKTDMAKIASERADQDAAARAAELAKNIADLAKLSAATGAKAAPAAAASQAKPAASAPALAVAAAPVAPAVAASAAAPAASAPVAAASAPAKPKLRPPVAVPVPPPEPSLMEQLSDNPVLPIGAGGVVALLAGLFLYRRYQKKKNAVHVDSSFLDSRLQPDSFFGASGGQRVDTGQEGVSGSSSMAYTHSQLDSADDVDPVAEADVYLAYGRDAQAEEILKEAVRHNPSRVAIHTKLLEIYAKLRDAANFQATATTAFQLVGADSPEWARICEMGLGIDPENRLYQPGGATVSAFGNIEQQAHVAAQMGNSTIPVSAIAELPAAGSDLDLDLDLDLDFSADDEAPSASAPAPEDTESTLKLQAVQESVAANSIDYDMSGQGALDSVPAALDEPVPSSPETQFDAVESLPDLSMSMEGLNFDMPTEPQPPVADFQPTGSIETVQATMEAPLETALDGMMEFDLGSLSLDLAPPSDAEAEAEDDVASLGNNSLETKLALAEEFVSIGDQDGARALIEEVVSEATGELREKAQRALANLS